MKREAVVATCRLLIRMLDAALQCRRRADHALGFVEHDPRLVAGGCGGVDLGAVLAVGDQQVEADAGGKSALAVLPRHRAVSSAEASQAIRALPAEQAADDEGLPGSKHEGLAGPLALGVTEETEEVDRVPGRPEVEPESSGCGRGEVGEMTLAGQTDEAVREDPPVGHSSCVACDRVLFGRRLSHGRAGTPRRGPRAAARRPGCGSARRGHAELGGDPDHDVDLLVGDRDVGRLHRVAVRRLDHRAVALDRGHRLDPERMRLAVGGEQAAIEAGQETELRQLFRQALPFLPGLVAEAGGARRDLGGGPWFGLVQAALAGVAAQPDDVARQGLASTHRRLTFEVRG